MDNPSHHWYLVPSPVLGPATWYGVAEVLSSQGEGVEVAKTTMTTTATEDHVAPWLDEVAAPGPPADGRPVVLVGHSAACPRLPLTVHRLLEDGWPVEAMICVDGRYPDGLAFTESGPRFGQLLDGLVRPDDYLPPWPRWWGSLIEGLVVDPAARDLIFGEAPPIPRRWFDQAVPVPDLPAQVKRGFLSFGAGYREACDRAYAEGWTVHRLEGDHLHQVVAPQTVTRTLIAMVACMEAAG